MPNSALLAPPAPPASLRTIRDWIRWGASEFARNGLHFGHGTATALDEAFHLVLWQLRLPYDLPAVYLEANLDDDECAAVAALLRERVQSRKPAAYLTKEAWFAGLVFELDERALVPRSPIAELVEAGFAPWLVAPPGSILDLCAGSGCIGIACALRFPEAQIDLAELDAGALALLGRNVERHGLGGRVGIFGGDLFAPLHGRRYDLIVSNPPYVPTAEWLALPPEYQHEPRIALDAGADGMDIVARILEAAPQHLGERGTLVCEIGGSIEEFDARFPQIPVIWPEFEHGGDGVFVIARAALAGWLAGLARPARSRPRKAG